MAQKDWCDNCRKAVFRQAPYRPLRGKKTVIPYSLKLSEVAVSVLVTLSTTLRAYAPGYDPAAGMAMDLAGATSVRELAEKIGLPVAEIKIIMVNGRHAPLDQALRDGDRVAYFPAVGGG